MPEAADGSHHVASWLQTIANALTFRQEKDLLGPRAQATLGPGTRYGAFVRQHSPARTCWLLDWSSRQAGTDLEITPPPRGLGLVDHANARRGKHSAEGRIAQQIDVDGPALTRNVGPQVPARWPGHPIVRKQEDNKAVLNRQAKSEPDEVYVRVSAAITDVGGRQPGQHPLGPRPPGSRDVVVTHVWWITDAQIEPVARRLLEGAAEFYRHAGSRPPGLSRRPGSVDLETQVAVKCARLREATVATAQVPDYAEPLLVQVCDSPCKSDHLGRGVDLAAGQEAAMVADCKSSPPLRHIVPTLIDLRDSWARLLVLALLRKAANATNCLVAPSLGPHARHCS